MNTVEVKKIWEDVKKELVKTIPESSYAPWIEPLEAISFEDNQFTLISGQMIAVTYLKSKHYKQILEGFKKVINQDIIVNLEYDEELDKKIKKEKKLQEKKVEKEKLTQTQHEQAIENLSYVQSMNLNLKYRFDNFVTDENNKLAKAAAQAVSENPNAKYNPLYIYGSSGLGKTHLMQAIGHALIKTQKIRCIKSEDFINEYINSTARNQDYNKNNLMNKFRQKYRNVDVLLIDDIQFIEGKKQCMEELFNTFDTLYNANKQIVLTSDRLPKEMPAMPTRLVSRFEQGLVVEIQAPKEETRIKILENLAISKNIKVSTDVLSYIAINFKNNVRELEGAFNKVEAFASFENTEITLEFAKNILKCEENLTKPDIEKVANFIAQRFNITIKDLKSPSRVANISTARATAAYISREKLNLNYENIANFFNKKHQTIIYSCEKIKEKLKSDKNFDKEFKNLLKDLNLFE